MQALPEVMSPLGDAVRFIDGKRHQCGILLSSLHSDSACDLFAKPAAFTNEMCADQQPI